jgi:hypothetical protein
MKYIIYILILGTLGYERNTPPNHPIQKKNTEAVILTKIYALPEVKEWFETAKKSKPELIVGEPDPQSKSSQSKYYSVQVGIGNFDMFRTNWWLYVDPKTYKIYYWDQSDTANSLITLQQWRYWRNKPGFNSMHYYKAGKMMVLYEGNSKDYGHTKNL